MNVMLCLSNGIKHIGKLRFTVLQQLHLVVVGYRNTPFFQQLLYNGITLYFLGMYLTAT